jgi:hypothetical protein
MSLARNQQTKLLAGALSTASGSCFTVGIATPLAGYLYNIGGLRGAIGAGTLALGLAVWFLAAAALHLAARRVLKGLDR